MSKSKFSLKKQAKSFLFAFNGLKILVTEEHNARIHLFMAIGVTTAGFFFNISILEWIAVVFAIGFVITIEIINSSLENIADFISPKKHNSIKRIKDLSAAAVLVSAVTACIIGLIIFLPKITI